MRIFCRWLTAAALALGGCASIQDFQYDEAQKLRAHRAWWFCPESRCDWNPASDYSCGWRAGYAAILGGSDGLPPPVPPTRYWAAKYQNESGQDAIACWYLGYNDGVAAAISSCGGLLHEVPVSPQINQFNATGLSEDRAPFANGRTIRSSERVDGKPATPRSRSQDMLPKDGIPPVPAIQDADRNEPYLPEPAVESPGNVVPMSGVDDDGDVLPAQYRGLKRSLRLGNEIDEEVSP